MAHMHRLGFSPLGRNERTRYGEIDLIAFDGRTLVFAEVKTRRVNAQRQGIRPDQQPLDVAAPAPARTSAPARRGLAARGEAHQAERPHDPLRRDRGDPRHERPADQPRPHRGGVVTVEVTLAAAARMALTDLSNSMSPTGPIACVGDIHYTRNDDVLAPLEPAVDRRWSRPRGVGTIRFDAHRESPSATPRTGLAGELEAAGDACLAPEARQVASAQSASCW